MSGEAAWVDAQGRRTSDVYALTGASLRHYDGAAWREIYSHAAE